MKIKGRGGILALLFDAVICRLFFTRILLCQSKQKHGPHTLTYIHKTARLIFLSPSQGVPETYLCTYAVIFSLLPLLCLMLPNDKGGGGDILSGVQNISKSN